MRQRRLVALFLVLVLGTLALPLGGARTLAASAPKAPDLPTALLRPADLGHSGYQVQNVSSDTAETLAGNLQHPQLAHQLAAATFVRRYQQTLATPAQTDPHQVGDNIVNSFIDTYRTVHGAAAGFTLIAGLNAPSDTLKGQPAIGDQSVWTLTTSSNPDTGSPMDDLGVLVRVGNHIVGVDVVGLLNGAPPVTEVQALTAKLLKRLATGGGPGLSMRVTRIDGDVQFTTDGYLRLGRKDLPFLIDDPTSAAVTHTRHWYGTATDIYGLTEQLGTGTVPMIVGVTVLAFPDATHAAAAVHGWRAYSVSLPGHTNYQPVPSLGHLGDESVAFTYTVTDRQGGKTEGVAVVVRLKMTVYLVYARGPRAPTVAAMTTLVRDQVSCAKGATKACTLATAPTGLTGS